MKHWARTIALRDKIKYLQDFTYARAMTIETAAESVLGKLPAESKEEIALLKEVMNNAQAIRDYLEEIQ